MAQTLAFLPPVQRLSPLCIRIMGGNPGKFTLQGTNTYLLGSGPRRILLDTGEGRPEWLSALRDTLASEGAVVDTALISHWHHDHVGGISQLLEVSPSAKVYKHTPGPGQLGIEDGQKFTAEGVTLEAFHTPGHTEDHTVFVLAEEDAMFTADNVLGHGTAVFEDLAVYLQSLGRMRDLFAGRAYPGHGPVIEHGPSKIAEYIHHRKQREDQVIQTLRAADTESWTAMQIVESVYSEVPKELHFAAHGGVLQILGKLEAEGRVRRAGEEGWVLSNHPSVL